MLKQEINAEIVIEIIINGKHLIIDELKAKSEVQNGIQCDFQKER